MGISKVVYGDATLIDLTGDTVTADKILSGYTAHNAAGNLITGTAVIPTKTSDLINDSGFISALSLDLGVMQSSSSSDSGSSGSEEPDPEIEIEIDPTLQ